MARSQRYGSGVELARSIRSPRSRASGFGQPEPAHPQHSSRIGHPEMSYPISRGHPVNSARLDPAAAAQVVHVARHRQAEPQRFRAFPVLLDAVVVMHQNDLLTQTGREFFEVAEQAVYLSGKVGERTVVEEDAGAWREPLHE